MRMKIELGNSCIDDDDEELTLTHSPVKVKKKNRGN